MRLLRVFPAIGASCVATAIGAGCLLTSDFDGIVGGSPGARPPDDAGAEDAAVPDGDAGQRSPCVSSDHVVCNDFDHEGAGFPIPGWNYSTSDGGALSLDDTTSISPPRALRARVQSEGEVSAYLHRQAFLGTFTALTARFDIRIVRCVPQGSSLTFVYMEPSARASFGFVQLMSGVQAVGAGVDGAFTFFQLERQIPEDTWGHIDFRITPKDNATVRFEVRLDDAVVVDTDAPSAAMRETALLNLGILTAQAPQGCEVAFDNYVLDVE